MPANQPILKSKPTLADIQDYISTVSAKRGFDTESVQDVFLLLTEEVGELAKSLRKQSGIKLADDSKQLEVNLEAADVLWLLIYLCNIMDIDLEKALRAKEQINIKRHWR